MIRAIQIDVFTFYLFLHRFVAHSSSMNQSIYSEKQATSAKTPANDYN